jgi:hypothetical protein
MEDEQWGNWRYLLSSTAIELFEHYGVSLHDEAQWTPVLGEGEHVAGSVYFGGDSIRGALTVCATRDLLGRATPVPPDRPIPLSDFAREIANQILGGLKTKLVRHGVDFSYAFADPGKREAGFGGDARTLVLKSSGGEVALLFVVTSNVELAAPGEVVPQEAPKGPGGLILL